MLDEHDVGTLTAERGDPGVAGVRLADSEPTALQQRPDRCANERIIIDDQDHGCVHVDPILTGMATRGSSKVRGTACGYLDDNRRLTGVILSAWRAP
jgi:hypothetical protein